MVLVDRPRQAPQRRMIRANAASTRRLTLAAAQAEARPYCRGCDLCPIHGARAAAPRCRRMRGRQSRRVSSMQSLRDLSKARPTDRVIAAPGVYDMVSLRMAAAMGFDALYMTGYGTVASHLGLPDAGLASYADMVGRVEAMARMAGAPLIADGDTGYGGLLNVRHAVRGYERAGAAAIQLEDQEFPKKCGHTPGRRVVPGGRHGAQDRGRGRSANEPRFSHHRPHRRAVFARPRRSDPARAGLRQGGGGHAVRRIAGDGRRRWSRSAASSATSRSSPTWSRADARRC